jgi:hypothetical protein
MDDRNTILFEAPAKLFENGRQFKNERASMYSRIYDEACKSASPVRDT